MKHPQKYSAKSLEMIVQVRAKRQAVLDELNGCERLDRYKVLIKELRMCNKLLNNTKVLL